MGTLPFSHAKKDAFSSSAVFLNRLLVVFFILTLVVAFLTIWNHFKVMESTSVFVMEGISGKAKDRILGFFTPIAKDAVLLQQWGRRGVLETSSPDGLDARLVPMIGQQADIHSIMLWKDNVIQYGLIRDNQKWLTLNRIQNKKEAGKIVWKSMGMDGKALDTWKDDPLTKVEDAAGWHHPPELLNAQAVSWVRTRVLPPANKSGLSAVAQWHENGTKYTAAVSVLTTRLEQVLDDVMVGETYRFFLFSRDNFFINFQKGGIAQIGNTEDIKTGYIYPVDDPVLSRAFERWKADNQPAEPFKFQWEQGIWYGQFLKINSDGSATGLGIIASEKDLVSQERDVRFFFIPVVMGGIWIGLFIYARIYKKEAESLAKMGMVDAVGEKDLLKIIGGGETESVEFKSTLRWNLKADRAGKEIEMASLKTVAAFMNSDGGILFVGVADNGDILGISNDRFPNDDKYLRHFSSIFNQHIGLEFSEYIDFGLKKVSGKEILVVNCKKSLQPVFLKHKNEEQFFIRSGPSSRQLSISQVLEYLKDKPMG